MQTKEFVLLCIINCIIVLLYILWNLLRKKEKKAGYWVKVMVMFFCPVAGPCFVFLSYFFMKILFSQISDLYDVVFSKERAETYLHADEERGRNLVSLEEALAPAMRKVEMSDFMSALDFVTQRCESWKEKKEGGSQE